MIPRMTTHQFDHVHNCLASAFNVAFGRTDVVFTTADFVFTPTSKSSKRNFTIVDDDVLEFDELFIVEFTFSPEISNKWYAIKENPSIVYIIIRDDDCKLRSPLNETLHDTVYIIDYTYMPPSARQILVCPLSNLLMQMLRWISKKNGILLLKVMAKSVSHYPSVGSSLFLCLLLLKSPAWQLNVGCIKCMITQLMASQNPLAEWDFDAPHVSVAECCLHSGVVAYWLCAG